MAKKRKPAPKVPSRKYVPRRNSMGALALGPVKEWLPRAIIATVAAALASYLLLGYCGWAPLLVAPVLAGMIAGLIAEGVIPAAAAGALGGLIGASIATSDFTVDKLVKFVEAAPSSANPDVLVSQLYQDFLLKLVQANPANANVNPGPMGVVVITFFGASLVAGLLAWSLVRTARRDLVQSIAGWGVTAALAIVLIVTGWTYGASYRASLSQQLVDGGYAYDAYIYQRAYQEMLNGSTYYQALVKACAGDKRLIQEQAVRNGKFYSFIPTPTLAREPWAFYLWRLAAPNGAPGVFLLALFLSAATLLAVHWGLREYSLTASLVAPVLLLPMFLLMSVWENIFFPDYWAGIAAVASLAFLVRRQLVIAAALALAAALFRETLVIWLMAIAVLGAVRVRSSKHGVRDLAIIGGFVAIFGGLYALHFHQAGQMIAAEANQGAGGFITRLKDSAMYALDRKFVSPLSYMMWPYGFFRFPPAIYAFIGIAGYALSFADQRSLKWTLVGYGAFWILYYLTIGAASSYWGQQVLPFYLVGVALMMAWLAGDRGTTGMPNLRAAR